MIRALELGLDVRVRFPADAASNGMVDRLRMSKPTRYFTKPPRPTQPPTLRGTGNSAGPVAVMIFDWGVKAGWLIPLVGKRVGGR